MNLRKNTYEDSIYLIWFKNKKALINIFIAKDAKKIIILRMEKYL